jgi:putative membrane protein
MMWDYYGYWSMGFGMLVWLVLVIGLLALAGYGLVSLFNRRPGPQPVTQPDAREILKARYARGEITTGEYNRIREELKE